DRRRIDLNEAKSRVIRHQVATAPLAILTVASLRLHEFADKLGPLCEPDVLRLPHRKRGYGCGGPRAARRTVAVTHFFGRALHLKLHCPAEATDFVHNHCVLLRYVDESSDIFRSTLLLVLASKRMIASSLFLSQPPGFGSSLVDACCVGP